MEKEKNEVAQLSESWDSSKKRAFKAAFQIGIFLSFALIFSLQSCGSKSSSSNGSDDNNGLSAEFGTSTDSGNKKGYEIVPLVWRYDTTNINCSPELKYQLYDYYTLKDNKGDYITFDNDADYIKFCPEIDFINGVYFHNVKKEIGCDSYEFRKEELNKAYEYFGRLIDGVDSYLSGNKENISDPELLEQIDKYYYNNKDYLFDYYCWNSSYNSKVYNRADKNYTIIVAPRKGGDYALANFSESFFSTINGENIPSNAIVFKILG